MSDIFSPSILSAVAAFLGAAATVVISLVAWLIYRRDQVNRSTYDEGKGVAALSMLRSVYEDRISELTDRLTATEERWTEVNHLILDAQKTQSSEVTNSEAPVLYEDNPFLSSLGIDLNAIEVDPKLIFVLTPFSEREREVYEAVRDACAELGLYASRGDEEFIEGPILPHVVRQILRARIVIGNITSRNPNVFYELGIAQAVGKPTLVVSKGRNRALPFDLRSRRVVFFEDYAELRQALQIELARWVIDQPQR